MQNAFLIVFKQPSFVVNDDSERVGDIFLEEFNLFLIAAVTKRLLHDTYLTLCFYSI